MSEERINDAVWTTLNNFANSFRHRNIFDDWDIWVKDITREEKDEARRIVESLESHTTEIVELLISLYKADVAQKESTDDS